MGHYRKEPTNTQLLLLCSMSLCALVGDVKAQGKVHYAARLLRLRLLGMWHQHQRVFILISNNLQIKINQWRILDPPAA